MVATRPKGKRASPPGTAHRQAILRCKDRKECLLLPATELGVFVTKHCNKVTTVASYSASKMSLFENNRKIEIQDVQDMTKPQAGPENTGKLLHRQKGGRWEWLL